MKELIRLFDQNMIVFDYACSPALVSLYIHTGSFLFVCK